MKDKIKQWLDDKRFYWTDGNLTKDGTGEAIDADAIEQCFNDLCLSNEWVSVDDRLPNPNQKVLTASKDGRIFYTMFLQGQVKHSFSCILSVHDHDNVTHWQNLPLPPSESGE